MSGSGRFLASGLVTAALAILLAALSGVPYDPGGFEASAVLRLSWRTRAAAVRECREPTSEELARLPAHMQRDRICDWRVPPHRLRVAVDGRVLENVRIEAAGARGDRPLYVHREFPLVPGAHELEVEFFPEDPGSHEAGSRKRDETEAEARRTLEREPTRGEGVRLALRLRVELAAREVALVTYDPDAGRLVLRGPRER